MEIVKNNFETQEISEKLPLERVPCHFPETITVQNGLIT